MLAKQSACFASLDDPGLMCDAEVVGSELCVNPFSKVGVRAAQDGGVHLEKNKFRWMAQYAILRADAGREGTPPCHFFCCNSEPRWLFDGPLLITY